MKFIFKKTEFAHKKEIDGSDSITIRDYNRIVKSYKNSPYSKECEFQDL